MKRVVTALGIPPTGDLRIPPGSIVTRVNAPYSHPGIP